MCLFFVFIFVTLEDGSKTIFLLFMAKCVLPMFSSNKSFIVSSLTFRPLIHFEFTFVYGVRECSSVIRLHVSNVSNYTLHVQSNRVYFVFINLCFVSEPQPRTRWLGEKTIFSFPTLAVLEMDVS